MKVYQNGASRFRKFRRTIAEKQVEEERSRRREMLREERRSRERQVMERRKESKEREDRELKFKRQKIHKKNQRVSCIAFSINIVGFYYTSLYLKL